MVFRCFQPWSISICCRSSVDMIRWILANYLQRCAIIWYEVSSNLGPWFWRAGLLSCREVFSLVQDSGSSQRLDYFKLQDRTIFLEKWTRGRCWKHYSGHLAHGLALGDWSCSSIWSGSEMQHTWRWDTIHPECHCHLNTGVFREFFTKPLMIDFTFSGSEKAKMKSVMRSFSESLACRHSEFIPQFLSRLIFCIFVALTALTGWRRDPGRFPIASRLRVIQTK